MSSGDSVVLPEPGLADRTKRRLPKTAAAMSFCAEVMGRRELLNAAIKFSLLPRHKVREATNALDLTFHAVSCFNRPNTSRSARHNDVTG